MSNVEISKKLVMINSASAVLKSLIQLGVVVWLMQHLANFIPDAEFKVYAIVQALMLFVPLLSMAVGGGLTRFITEGYARGDERRVTQIVSTMAPYCLGTGLIVLAGGAVFAFYIDRIMTIDPAFADDARMMFAILVLVAAIRISTMPFMVGLQVTQRFVIMHVVGLASQFIWMAAIFGLIFGVSTRALWVSVAAVPSTIFEVTTLAILSHKALPALRWRLSEFHRDLVRPLLSFGGWTMIARVAAVAREACGTLILNECSSGTDVQRDQAVKTFRLGSFVETRVFPLALVPLSTTLPALTAMEATGQLNRLRHAFFRITRYVLWAFLLPAIPLIIFREEFWMIYIGAKEFAKVGVTTATVMTLLLTKAIVVFPQPVLAQLVAAKNMTKPMAIRVVILEASTVLATLYAVAVHDFSAVGAAAVTLAITLVGSPALHWTLGLKLTGARWSEWIRETLMPGFVPAIVTVPVCYGLRWIAVPNDVITLCTYGFIACAVYFATLVTFCLAPNERADLAKVIARAKAILPGGR